MSQYEACLYSHKLITKGFLEEVCLQGFLECGYRGRLPYGDWQIVPQFWTCHTERSVAVCLELGPGLNQNIRGSRAKASRWGVWHEQLLQIVRALVV